MSNLNDLKNHLASVQTTRQITNAMSLLSTSRLKKDMMVVPALTDYLQELRLAMQIIIYYTEKHNIHHKFTEKDTVGRALYLVVMGDKSLCGDYNAKIAALTKEVKERDPEGEIVVHNQFCADYLKRRGIEADYVLDHSTIHITEDGIRTLSDRLISMYMTDYFNEVYVISTQYSKTERKPACIKLLPLKKDDFIDTVPHDEPDEMLFAPGIQEHFAKIVPEYVMGLVFDLILQAAASENASRMEAMQSATDNADEMIDALSAKLNAERQLGITNEITEITASQL